MNRSLTSKDRIAAAILKQHKAADLRMIGWELLLFDSIPVVFIGVGFRVGSNLWLWWSLIEGLFGIGLIRVAGRINDQATRQYGEAAEKAAMEPVAKPEEMGLRAA
ncbi:MAG: hypothetical protein WCC59_06965 [Terriglobales bacterium]